MNKRVTLWALAGCLILGLALRIHTLTDRSLWFDEAFSVRLIDFSWTEMIDRAATDVHPPLYYAVLKVWAIVFGNSVQALRSFSVVFSGLSILAAYLFAGYAARSRAVGLTAALLLAISSWQISYGWEARMYALGIFLSLMSSWLLLKSLRSSGKNGLWWVLYALTTLAFAYTHYFAFFTMAAQALFVAATLLSQTRGRLGELITNHRLWLSLGAALAVVVGYLPWLPVFIAQNSQVQANYWVPKLGGWSIPDTFYRMLKLQVSIPPHDWPTLLLTLIPMALVIGLWVGLPLRCRTRAAATSSDCDGIWLVVLSGSIPIILAAATSFLGQSLYQDRFLVFTHAFIVIIIAVGIHRLPWPIVRRGALTLLVLLFAVGHYQYLGQLNFVENTGAHAATQAVYAAREGSEPVLVNSPFVFFSIDHYAIQEFSSQSRPQLLSESGEFLHFAGGPIITDTDLYRQDNLIENPPQSLWLVDTTGFGGQETDLGPEWIQSQRQVFSEVFPHQGDVIISRYQLRR